MARQNASVSVVELRQYTLVPGERDALIGLFEAELIVPQEDCGMQIIGTFQDLDDGPSSCGCAGLRA